MEEKNIVIGIEGLVGSGKTSICRKMLEIDKSFVLLNGGNLYRAIVYTLMQKEKNLFKTIQTISKFIFKPLQKRTEKLPKTFVIIQKRF